MTNFTLDKRSLLAGTALRGSVAGVALAAALMATPALAQEASTTAAADSETIIVTGTLIRNPNLERSAPVNVTTADDIELRQLNNAETLLREIPGITPSIGSAVNNGNGGASFANLRDLGSNRNIVLLDGVRLVPSDLNGRFDLNNVPVALIERVDVLTGGASTTYGADAVAGVVNFVTRRDFAGVELSAGTGINFAGDGPSFRADLTIGANFDDGRGNVVLGIGYQEVDAVFQGDRDFSRFQIDSFNGTRAGSGTSTPSRFSGVNPTTGDFIANPADGAQICNPGLQSPPVTVPGLPNCANPQAGLRQVTADGTAFRPGAAFDAFNFNPFNIFQTPFERFNIYGSGRYEINDAVEIYSRAIFSKNTVSTIIAPSGAFGISVTVPLNNPFLTTAQRNAFCNFDTNAGVGVTPRFDAATCAAASVGTLRPGDANYREVTSTLARRATELGPRISEYVTTFFDYQFGARGGITDNISWDLWGSYGESENQQNITGYWLNSRVIQALRAGRDAAGNPVCFNEANGCVPINLFGADGSITPAQNAFVEGTSTILTESSLSQVRGTIAGDFGGNIPWASNPVAFAVGVEYRNYGANIVSDAAAKGGDLGGFGGAQPDVDGGFNVYEAFGEIVVPLVQDRPGFEDLTLEGGIRYSSYSIDAPSNPSFDTWTWKAGGSWSPGGGFRIRGNYARAVRAPNIFELFNPVNTVLTNLADDPCANQDDAGNPIPGRPAPSGELRAICLAQGAPASQIGFIGVPTAGQAQTTGGGNINLEPETSDSWTLGAVWTPTFAPGLSLTIDYYDIRVNNAITQPTPADAIEACFGPLPGLSPAAGASTTPECTSIRRNPVTGQLSGDASDTPGLPLTLSNLGRLETSGIDWSVNYAHDFDKVRWSLAWVGNWTRRSRFQAVPTGENRDCVGLYSVNCGFEGSITPEYQFSVRNTFSFDEFDVSVLWRHIAKVRYEFADDPDARAFEGTVQGTTGTTDFNFIPSYNYIDLSLRANLAETLTITFTVANLFDVQPKNVGNTIGSTSFNSGNVYPSTYDALGRRFNVGARLRF